MKYCVGQNGETYNYSLGAKTAASFLVCLTHKVVEVLEKYLHNIVRVGVEVFST